MRIVKHQKLNITNKKVFFWAYSFQHLNIENCCLNIATNKKKEGQLQGFKVSNGSLKVSHQQFVDDMFIFGRAKLTETRKIEDCLQK